LHGESSFLSNIYEVRELRLLWLSLTFAEAAEKGLIAYDGQDENPVERVKEGHFYR